jgi:hypothetical protein
MKVRSGFDPSKTWKIEIVDTVGETIRKLSLHELARLPADASGYHLVRIGD